ncbi:MAG: hypothetical protein QXG86_00960 [Candidatus Woesearchaeota archaeon]
MQKKEICDVIQLEENKMAKENIEMRIKKEKIRWVFARDLEDLKKVLSSKKAKFYIVTEQKNGDDKNQSGYLRTAVALIRQSDINAKIILYSTLPLTEAYKLEAAYINKNDCNTTTLSKKIKTLIEKYNKKY